MSEGVDILLYPSSLFSISSDADICSLLSITAIGGCSLQTIEMSVSLLLFITVMNACFPSEEAELMSNVI